MPQRGSSKRSFWQRLPTPSNDALGLSLRGELHRQAFDACDEVGVEAFWFVGGVDVWEAFEELLEDGFDFESGEAGAEAEVFSDAAGEVVVGVAGPRG
jgi:hypothetical protein